MGLSFGGGMEMKGVEEHDAYKLVDEDADSCRGIDFDPFSGTGVVGND